MKPTIKIDEFLNNNKQAFWKVSGGRRLKLPRTKKRSKEEFIALGQVVIETIKTAEREGRFIYDPEKGLTIRWKP